MLAWMLGIIERRRQVPGAAGLAINPREIQGGTGRFTVADECSAALDVHLPPGLDVTLVRSLIEESRATVQADHPGCQLGWDETLWAPGYTTDPASSVLAPVRHAFELVGLPFEPASFRSHSDAVTLREAGMTPLVCGPGLLEVAHTTEEHVHLAEVYTAAHLYAALFANVVGSTR
jgi:acetylornithine deacetylase